MSFNNFISPKTFSPTVHAPSAFGDDNVIDLVEEFGENSVATYSSISNYSNGSVLVRLNGDEDTDFFLHGNTNITFHYNDIHVTSYDFAITGSGGTSCELEIICGVQKP